MRKVDLLEMRNVDAGKFYFGEEIYSNVKAYGFFDENLEHAFGIWSGTDTFVFLLKINSSILFEFGKMNGKFGLVKIIGNLI